MSDFWRVAVAAGLLVLWVAMVFMTIETANSKSLFAGQCAEQQRCGGGDGPRGKGRPRSGAGVCKIGGCDK
jgi:hypothetical protein